MFKTVDQQLAKKVAEAILSIDAMSFRFDPPYTYTSGLKSPVYLDNRLIISYPEKRDLIVDAYCLAIKNTPELIGVEYISATATAAIPQGAMIAQKLNLPMVYVRSSAKGHGKGNKVEGYLKKGAKVLIIEDHISTAGSLLDNASAITEAGGEVIAAVGTTSYESEAAKENLKTHGITAYILTNWETLISTAEELGKMTAAQKSIVEAWHDNPKNWSDDWEKQKS